MRAGLAGLFFFQGLPNVAQFSKQPAPVGLGHWINFTFFAHPQVMLALKGLLAVVLCLYVVGLFPVITLSYMAFMSVGLGTLFNSQHAIGHSYQPLSLVIVVQWLFVCALQIGRRFHWQPSYPPPDLEVHYSKQTLAAVYMVAAITKLARSEGGWLMQLPGIVVQLQKTQDQFFYDHLKPLGEDWLASFTNLLLHYPALTYLFFGAGLFLEFFAFLGLISRSWGLAVGLGLLTMHYLADQIMGLSFTVLSSLVVIYFVNLPYWVVKMTQMLERVRARGSALGQPAPDKLAG